MKITIEQVENGYILFFHDEEQTKKVVCADDEQADLKKLLYEVAECFGEPYDKYSETNVNITFDRKGHKFE